MRSEGFINKIGISPQLECWNSGILEMMGLENRNEYNCIDFLELIPSLPTFHYSINPCGFPIELTQKAL
jgi:hypothetical protein